MPINYDLVKSISDEDNSSPGRKNVKSEASNDETTNVSISHNFVSNRTKICRCCGGCTGFGHGCVILRREVLSPGDDCKCGLGDSGCVNCGLCRVCAKTETCCLIPRHESEPRSIPSTPSPRASSSNGAISPKGLRLDVRTKVLSQWRHVGGAYYPGQISKVNSDGTYDIFYDDGDRDYNVVEERIKVTSYSSPRHRAQRTVSSGSESGFSDHNYSSRSGSILRISSALFGTSKGIESNEEENPNEADSETGLGCNHVGSLTCRCGHNLGTIQPPLNPSYYHLPGRCTWNCCNATWEAVTCKASSGQGTVPVPSLVSSPKKSTASTLSQSVSLLELISPAPTPLTKSAPVVNDPITPKDLVDALSRQSVKYFPCDTWKDSVAIKSPMLSPKPSFRRQDSMRSNTSMVSRDTSSLILSQPSEYTTHPHSISCSPSLSVCNEEDRASYDGDYQETKCTDCASERMTSGEKCVSITELSSESFAEIWHRQNAPQGSHNISIQKRSSFSNYYSKGSQCSSMNPMATCDSTANDRGIGSRIQIDTFADDGFEYIEDQDYADSPVHHISQGSRLTSFRDQFTSFVGSVDEGRDMVASMIFYGDDANSQVM